MNVLLWLVRGTLHTRTHTCVVIKKGSLKDKASFVSTDTENFFAFISQMQCKEQRSEAHDVSLYTACGMLRR